jgi:hypothetical protein
MRTLRASHQGELSGILDYVHDRNYELSKVEHNARDKTLTIPVMLRSTKKSERKSWFLFGRRETATQGMLVVKKALGFKVVDNARIGQGDINTIELDGNKVIVKGGIPVNLLVDVEGFDIELVLPDDAKLA